jgi:hypothetical protein
VLITPSAWGSQLNGYNHHHQLHASHQVLFWCHCWGGKRRLLQGEFFARTSFTLLFVLLYFIYFYLHRFIKNPKKIESFVVVYYV